MTTTAPKPATLKEATPILLIFAAVIIFGVLGGLAVRSASTSDNVIGATDAAVDVTADITVADVEAEFEAGLATGVPGPVELAAAVNATTSGLDITVTQLNDTQFDVVADSTPFCVTVTVDDTGAVNVAGLNGAC